MDYSLIDLLGDEPVAVDLPSTVHESELAALLGITRQAIGDHVRSGVMKRSGRARFDLAASVKAYCQHLREHARHAGRPSETNADLKAEQLRLKRAQADAQESKNRQLSGELVDAAEVTRAWQSVLRDVRAAVLAVPSRYGAGMPHLSAIDIAALDSEIRAALEGLADGNA